MGKGNYKLGNDEYGQVLYIDYEAYYENELIDNELTTDAISTLGWIALKDNIYSLATNYLRQSPAKYLGERLILLESFLVQVSIIDWESYAAICVTVHDNIVNPPDDETAMLLSKATTNTAWTAKRIFKALFAIYGKHCRVRDTAWTSKPYKPVD